MPHKVRAFGIALLLVTVMFGTLSIATGKVSASSSIPSSYGWKGYVGNRSIYLTTDINSSNSYVPAPSFGNEGISNGLEGAIPTNNTVALSVGLTATSPNGIGQPFEEIYDSTNHIMRIWIPVSAAGASNWTVDTSTGSAIGTYIDYEQVSMAVPSAFNSSITSLSTSYQSGINVSSGYDVGQSADTLAWNTMWYLLGLIPFGVGDVVSTYNYEQSVFNPVGVKNPPTAMYGAGNFTQASYGLYNGQTKVGLTQYSSWGYDTFAVTTVLKLKINESDFTDSGNLIIGANNVEVNSYDGALSPWNGAYSNTSVRVVPAYTIQGYAYDINGQPLDDQELLLSTSDYNYYIFTNATGYYRFFARPGVNYLLTAPAYESIGGIQIDPTSTDVGGGNYNLHLADLTVSESGLSGQQWSVTLSGLMTPAGTVQSYKTSTYETSMHITVEADEQYGYSIGVPAGYTANRTSGIVYVGSGGGTVPIAFHKTPTYTVTFMESGLPSGTLWSATLNGSKQSSQFTTVSFNSIYNGSYSWTIPTVYYSLTLWYEADPNHGTVTVSGSSVTVDVNFIGVEQNPNSCVYAYAPVLLSNYTTQYAQNISMGDSVMTYNFTTQSFQPGTVDAVFVTQHSSMYVINGYLKVAGDQDIWTNHGYIQAQNLTGNDSIFNVFTHQFEKVRSISVEHGSFTMYDFYVNVNQNYIVWWNLMQDRLP